jgi:hypothetical protein
LTAPTRLAAIVFEKDERPDPPLAAFLDAASRRGVKIAGLVQEHAGGDGCALQHDAQVRDLTTGEILPIMQDLGAEATGCRVDPAAIALAARMLDRAREGRPDLLVVNRFGRLESEGGGMLAELGQAFADDLAILVCVPRRFLGAWDAFADGLDVKLPADCEALERWWRVLAPARPDAA